jgi:hypothetical protein
MSRPPYDPNQYPDDEPTVYANYTDQSGYADGTYGQPAAPEPPPKTPWHQKPAAMITVGAVAVVVLALAVYGIGHRHHTPVQCRDDHLRRGGAAGQRDRDPERDGHDHHDDRTDHHHDDSIGDDLDDHDHPDDDHAQCQHQHRHRDADGDRDGHRVADLASRDALGRQRNSTAR